MKKEKGLEKLQETFPIMDVQLDIPRPLEQRIREAKEKQAREAQLWTPKEGEQRAVMVTDLIPLMVKKLGKETEFYEFQDLETEEILRCPAHGMLKHRLQLGKCYVIGYVRKTDAGHLWKVTEILEK